MGQPSLPMCVIEPCLTHHSSFANGFVLVVLERGNGLFDPPKKNRLKVINHKIWQSPMLEFPTNYEACQCTDLTTCHCSFPFRFFEQKYWVWIPILIILLLITIETKLKFVFCSYSFTLQAVRNNVSTTFQEIMYSVVSEPYLPWCCKVNENTCEEKKNQ